MRRPHISCRAGSVQFLSDFIVAKNQITGISAGEVVQLDLISPSGRLVNLCRVKYSASSPLLSSPRSIQLALAQI